MDPYEIPNSRVLVTVWLQRLNPPARLVHFQIIDSLVWSNIYLGLPFNAQMFDFNPAYNAFATHVAAHFAALTSEQVQADCRSFAPLRPVGAPLPPILSRLGSNVMPAQQVPAQQPFQCTLASSGGFTDHVWRGLVDDHSQALAIL